MQEIFVIKKFWKNYFWWGRKLRVDPVIQVQSVMHWNTEKIFSKNHSITLQGQETHSFPKSKQGDKKLSYQTCTIDQFFTQRKLVYPH